jgi:8-oxo-dGTP diphosphatase
MSDRSSSRRASARGFAVGVELALFTFHESELGVLVRAAAAERSLSRSTLPLATLGADDTIDQRALDLAKEAAPTTPAILEQVGTFSARPQSAEKSRITVLYFGLLPVGTVVRPPFVWLEMSDALASLAPRQRDSVEAALHALRARVDQQPIAFRLLPTVFTLSDLQRIYELLLGRKLHKASFRRALHAASLVEATDEWRSEGRGRPAQLFRYAPPRRRRARRGVRFDALG